MAPPFLSSLPDGGGINAGWFTLTTKGHGTTPISSRYAPRSPEPSATFPPQNTVSVVLIRTTRGVIRPI